ncbi:MAG: hypothetical protein FJ399_17625, partial [Verrucomicrobia bacterium]|nr:hypothetical protein [Verrucomicrobiota bacterium]
MKTHRFGRTGLTVSALCLGTSNFARCSNQEETFAILDAFGFVARSPLAGGQLVAWPAPSLGSFRSRSPEDAQRLLDSAQRRLRGPRG